MAKAELMDYDKALELFEPVLGFEVHVELNTQTKMFSDAPNPAALGNVHAEPNTYITPVDLGLPGSLPVVNEQAIDRKSTRLNSSHSDRSRMPSSA